MKTLFVILAVLTGCSTAPKPPIAPPPAAAYLDFEHARTIAAPVIFPAVAQAKAGVRTTAGPPSPPQAQTQSFRPAATAVIIPPPPPATNVTLYWVMPTGWTNPIVYNVREMGTNAFTVWRHKWPIVLVTTNTTEKFPSAGKTGFFSVTASNTYTHLESPPIPINQPPP